MCAHPQRHLTGIAPGRRCPSGRVSRRRPGRSTCRFHRLHRIDIEVRAAQSTDPIVYAVAPVPSRVRRESLFEPQYRTYGLRYPGPD